MNINRLLAVLLVGAASAVGAAEEQTLTKAEAGKVAVSNCYRQCFDTMAAQDRGPVLRADEGSYGTEFSSWNGVKRCLAAIQSQYVMEQCSRGCEDLRDAYGGKVASKTRTRYLGAQRARRAFLRRWSLLPMPATYATFDQNCYDASDGLVFYGLRLSAWHSDPAFAPPTAADESVAYPRPAVGEEE